MLFYKKKNNNNKLRLVESITKVAPDSLLVNL